MCSDVQMLQMQSGGSGQRAWSCAGGVARQQRLDGAHAGSLLQVHDGGLQGAPACLLDLGSSVAVPPLICVSCWVCIFLPGAMPVHGCQGHLHCLWRHCTLACQPASFASPQSWQRTSFPDQSPVMVIHEFRCPTLSTPNNLLLQYAERLPIGLESVIRHVDAATVKGFYRKWYRPERMAVVCVGDFADPDAVVATLQAALSTASAASSAPAPSLPKYARPGLLGAFLCALGTRPLPRDWDLGCSEWRRLGASAVGMCCGCHAL